jgi:hypothetical protein
MDDVAALFNMPKKEEQGRGGAGGQQVRRLGPPLHMPAALVGLKRCLGAALALGSARSSCWHVQVPGEGEVPARKRIKTEPGVEVAAAPAAVALEVEAAAAAAAAAEEEEDWEDVGGGGGAAVPAWGPPAAAPAPQQAPAHVGEEEEWEDV